MYKPELDKLPVKEIEKKWERQSIADSSRLIMILEAYKEMEVNIWEDIYLRKPSLEELKADAECMQCYQDRATIDEIVIVYKRKEEK